MTLTIPGAYYSHLLFRFQGTLFSHYCDSGYTTYRNIPHYPHARLSLSLRLTLLQTPLAWALFSLVTVGHTY